MLCLENPHKPFQQKSLVKQWPYQTHTMPTAHGMEPKAMPQNPLLVTPNISPATRIITVEAWALATEQGTCLLMELSSLNVTPTLTCLPV